MVSSDERVATAQKLRANAAKRGVLLDYLVSEQVNSWWLLLHSIGCDSNHQDVVFTRLADLIDPTCEVVPFDEESMRLPHCSRCGQPMLKPWPNHCPNCGARIARHDDN